MRAGIKQVETPKYADLFKILMPKVKALEKLHNVEFPNQHLKYLFTLIMSNEGSDVFIKKYIYIMIFQKECYMMKFKALLLL